MFNSGNPHGTQNNDKRSRDHDLMTRCDVGESRKAVSRHLEVKLDLMWPDRDESQTQSQSSHCRARVTRMSYVRVLSFEPYYNP